MRSDCRTARCVALHNVTHVCRLWKFMASACLAAAAMATGATRSALGTCGYPSACVSSSAEVVPAVLGGAAGPAGSARIRTNSLPPDAGPGRAGRAQLMTSLNFLNILQSSIIFSGLVAGLVVCSKAGPPATVGEGEDTLCFPPPPALCDLLARVDVCIGARWRQECAGSRTELSPAACSIGFRASRGQSVSQAARRVTQTGAPQGVAEGRLTVGDAVLFITLMQQLYAPLNYFGSYCAARRLSVVD